VSICLSSSGRIAYEEFHQQRMSSLRPEGEDHDGKDVKAEIKVVRKFLAGNHLREISIGRRKRIARRLWFAWCPIFELLLLQNAQQFFAAALVGYRDFVEKEGSLSPIRNGRSYE